MQFLPRIKQALRLDSYYNSNQQAISKALIVATFTSFLYLFCAYVYMYNFKILHILLSAKFWWSNGDSNPGPPACKAGALAN